MTTDAPEAEQGDAQTGCTAATNALGEQTPLDLFKTASFTTPSDQTTNQWLQTVGFSNLDSLRECESIPKLMADRADHSDGLLQTVADRSNKTQDQPLKEADLPGEQADDIWNRYGVDVKERTVNGKKQYVYQYEADGKTITANVSDATPQGLERALKEIEQKTKAEMRKLELEFGIKIPGPGERIGDQTNLCTGEKGEEVKTRLPTMAELAGLRDGLKNARPAQHPQDGKKVHFYFADKPLYTGPSSENAPMMTHEARNGNPSIIISPEARNNFPAMTDKDFDPDSTPEERRGWNSFSSAINHELGHTTHYNFDKNMKVPDKFLGAMGIERIPNPDEPGETMDAIRTTDNKLFVFLPEAGSVCGSDAGGKWYRVNEKGEPLDKDGNVVKVDGDISKLNGVESLTRDEMQYRAANPASSQYADSPAEIIAEALKNYRRNPETRELLRKENPLLYKVAEELDQRDIDRTYPGRGFVRREDGTIGIPRASRRAN